MDKSFLSTELRQRLEPLLPTPKPRRFRYSGRKPHTHRPAVTRPACCHCGNYLQIAEFAVTAGCS
jgi:hypothetical protein